MLIQLKLFGYERCVNREEALSTQYLPYQKLANTTSAHLGFSLKFLPPDLQQHGLFSEQLHARKSCLQICFARAI